MESNFLQKSSVRTAVANLSEKQLGNLIKSLVYTGDTGGRPEGLTDEVVIAYYNMIISEFDSMNIQKEKIRQRNIENGKKGGRPRKELKTQITQNNPNNPLGFLGYLGFQNKSAPHVNNINNINNINKHEHVRTHERACACAREEKENSDVSFSSDLENSEKQNSFSEFDAESLSFSRSESLIADWNCFMAKWQELCESKAVKAEMPTWIETPRWILDSLFSKRRLEYGLEGLLNAVDRIRSSPYFKSRAIGVTKFLDEKTIPTLQSGGYDWNPDESKNKQPDNPKNNERDLEIIRRNELELKRILKSEGDV